jgi:AcrR family transcriptional regulator
MPKISEERKTERRVQILDGARRCFAENGYEGATVVKLEKQIGLSRGAIFNYFPSKEDLFIELAVRDSTRMSEVWITAGLEAVVREVMELDPAWLSVYLELFRRIRNDADFRERIESRQRQIAPRTASASSSTARRQFRDDLGPARAGIS